MAPVWRSRRRPWCAPGRWRSTSSQHVASLLGIDRAEILDAEWVDNGPGWVAVLLASADAVLALRPELGRYGRRGGRAVPGRVAGAQIEVRAFFPKDGAAGEDPVTGSLNASLAAVAAPHRPG